MAFRVAAAATSAISVINWSRPSAGCVQAGVTTFDDTRPFRGSEARAAGHLTRAVLRGPRYRCLGYDTYVRATVPDSPRLDAHAAVVRAGPASVLTGWSACRWWDCDVVPRPEPPVELAVPDRRLRPGPGLVVIHAAVRDDDVAVEDGVRVTTHLRTAYDLIARADLDTGVVVADGLARCGRFGPDDLRRITVELGPRRGCRRIEAVAGAMDPKSGSPQETRIRLRLLRAGLPAPETQYRVVDEPGCTITTDFAWPQCKVALEYDGHDHTADDRRGLDLDRIDVLRQLGWTVIVVSARQFFRPGWIERRVREELTAVGTR